MSKLVTGMTSIFAMFFILVLCTLGILAIFGAIDTSTLTDSALKAGGTLLILTVASFLISWLQTGRK